MLARAKKTTKTPEAKRENSVAKTQRSDFSRSINSPIGHILFLQRTIGNQAVQRLLKDTIRPLNRHLEQGVIQCRPADETDNIGGLENNAVTDYSFIRPNIDVAAQRAMMRMRRRGIDGERRAVELLNYTQNGTLRGFVGDDVGLAAQHATELGTFRWELVPDERDAAVVPGAGGSPPLAVYKEGARESRERMDSVAEVIYEEAHDYATGGGGGGSTGCSCSPAPSSPCSRINAGGGRTRQDIVFDAFQMAAGWLPGALQATEDYINASPQDRPNQRAAVPFRNHFNWPPVGPSIGDTPVTVRGVINRLLTDFTDPICPNCQSVCPCSGGDPWACSPNAWHNTNCYEFCDPFFIRANNTLRAKIAIHEMTHSWERMGDVAYEGDSNYPPNYITARQNADSYAAFIRDLG